MPLLPFINRQAPGPLLGLGLAYPSAGALERIGPDWDWIWIDAQHGDIDIGEAASLVRTAELIARPALVRIPAQDAAWVGKMLDFGAAGVIVPMIKSLEQAKAMIFRGRPCCKPRSSSALRRADGFLTGWRRAIRAGAWQFLGFRVSSGRRSQWSS